MEGQSSDSFVTSASRKCTAVTGSGRKMKDNAADWHNLVLRWEKLNDEGSSVANMIVNQRLKEGEHPPSSTVDRPPSYSRHLEEKCSKLLDVVDKMAAIVSKMERLVSSQKGVMDLEKFQFGDEGRLNPLFHGWPTAQFVDLSHCLLESYKNELKLKQTIVQEVAHTENPDLSMVYLSSWLHQPFSHPGNRLSLEALLMETGHRSL